MSEKFNCTTENYPLIIVRAHFYYNYAVPPVKLVSASVETSYWG